MPHLFIDIKKESKVKLSTTSDILKLIENGENEKIEFKSSLRYDYHQVNTDKNLEHVILKSIAGFLNGKGGTLLIGVDDYGEILGLANDYWSLKRKTKDGFEQRLMLIISNAFGKDICSKIQASFHTIKIRKYVPYSLNALKGLFTSRKAIKQFLPANRKRNLSTLN